jgi:DNA-binding IclR family transcriptional regulator
MIQVIGRAFKILEEVAIDPLRVWSIAEMAKIIDVQSATCFHIANSMVELGYLERLGTRKGYRLGPAVNRLCHSPAYRPDLIEAADHLLRIYSETLNEPALLCVINGRKRYILCESGSGGKLKVNYNLTVIEDIYSTATGRILLSWQSEAQVKELVAAAGLPRGEWEEASTIEKLFEELKKIREGNGLVLLNNYYLAQVGFPVFDAEHKMVAAVGSYVPKYRFTGEHSEKVVMALLDVAAKISAALDNKSIIINAS